MTSDFAPFTVRAPASTANFGSAFDAVGMALDLWLEARVEPASENGIVLQGEGADVITGAAEDNLIFRAIELGYSRLGAQLPTMRVTLQNAIPLARGLGSSAAATAAGLLIANTLAGQDREADDMLADATQLEGHPDNAAPALMGGVCVAVVGEDELPMARALSFPHDLDCVAFVPDAELSTAQRARGAAPPGSAGRCLIQRGADCAAHSHVYDALLGRPCACHRGQAPSTISRRACSRPCATDASSQGSRGLYRLSLRRGADDHGDVTARASRCCRGDHAGGGAIAGH